MSLWKSPWASQQGRTGPWLGSPWRSQRGRIWTPADLFKSGEQGAWYDPSDLSTLFQDAAGTTPVTADGDPVGLMLDKHESDGRGVVNKFTWTEAIDNAAWAKLNSSVTADVVASPDGEIAADEFIPGGVSAPSLRQVIPFVSSLYTVSGYFKKNAIGLDAVSLNLAGTGGATGTIVIETGAVAAALSNFIRGSSEYVGGGWYRVSAVINNTFTGNTTARIEPRDAQGNTFIGDGASGVYVWGLQIELGDTLTNYQANAASAGGPGNHASQSVAASRPIYSPAAPNQVYETVEDEMILTLPTAPAAATVAIATETGADIQYPVDLSGGSYTINQSHSGLIILDRQLTASELAAVTSYLNQKAGV